MTMAKFRKKPVVIEAEQFFRDGHWPEGVTCAPDLVGQDKQSPHIKTLEGPLMVSDGDWIITGVAGEKYPCKPDIFAATYEPVEE